MCRRELQVNEKSAYQWRRAWASGGWEEICHRPPGCDYLLSSDLQTKLAAWLEQGPAAHGWRDNQVWAAARIRTLIGQKFHLPYSASGSIRLVNSMGFTVQMPPGPPPNVTRLRSAHGGRRSGRG